MVIQHNMAAMNTNRQLGISVGASAKSTEKLSSGYRINRAGDDAAGLAISEKMRSQIRGLDRASANSQDGISLIQTAEGALNETQNILQRMRELAVQAANGTNTDSDRNEIQKEVNQLTSEINRIGNTTEFNTMKLLKGSDGNLKTNNKNGGSIGDFIVDQKSVNGFESYAVLIGGIADATGKASEAIDVETAKKAGSKQKFAYAEVAGVRFESTSIGDTNIGGKSIQFLTIEEDGVEGISSGKIQKDGVDIVGTDTGIITIGLKKSTIDTITHTSDLMTILENLSGKAVKFNKGSTVTANSTGLQDLNLKLTEPEGSKTGSNPKPSLPSAVGSLSSSSTFTANVKGEKGEYIFNITDTIKEVGDTITILGQTFKAVSKDANANAGEFLIQSKNDNTSLSGQAASLIKAINANSVLKDKIIASAGDAADVATSGVQIKIADKTGFSGTIAEDLDLSVILKGSGGDEDDTLTITNGDGTNGVIYKLETGSTPGALRVSFDGNKTVKITLGKDAADNTAAKIQEKIRNLGKRSSAIHESAKDDNSPTVEIDFSKVTVKAGGNWDTSTTGYMGITKKTEGGTTGGGTRDKSGEYTFSLKSPMVDGDKITIAGKTFIAKADGANPLKGEIDVSNQDIATQVSSLVVALLRDEDIKSQYDVTDSGDGKITLTQKDATGKDLTEKDIEISNGGSSSNGTFDVTFQVGANTGQSMTIAIEDNRSAALGVAGNGTSKTKIAENGATAYYTESKVVTDGTTNDNVEYALDITSYEKATAAIGVIDDALSAISAQRSQLGAYQNRLEHTIANLDNTSENLQAAESRIRDVDMAKEMTNFSKNNILQQAAQSMLAQANQSTQGVLTLLR